MLVVSPERKEVKKYGEQVTAAQAQLSTAQGQLANARAAQSQYAAAYASVVSLGKAVPATDEVPSLIYQLEQVSNRAQRRIQLDRPAGASGSAAHPRASSSTAASPRAPASRQMPFTFIFNGGFFALEHLFRGLDRRSRPTPATATLQVSGRLLTIQSVKLAPEAGGAGRQPES